MQPSKQPNRPIASFRLGYERNGNGVDASGPVTLVLNALEELPNSFESGTREQSEVPRMYAVVGGCRGATKRAAGPT